MTLVIDDAAKEFGKVLGGNAAIALGEWFQKLWNSEGVANKQLLEEFVNPAFNLFLKIYSEYENSFNKYREVLLKADSEQHVLDLVNKIEGELRFTAKDRVDLLGHLKHSKNTDFSDFVNSITDFLVSNEASLSGNVEDSLSLPEINAQVFRRGLISDLKSVTSSWAGVLDPAASAPPLHGKELEATLDDMCKQYGLSKSDPKWEAKLRVRIAVNHLDSRTEAMLLAYKKVRMAYDTLKKKLSDES